MSIPTSPITPVEAYHIISEARKKELARRFQKDAEKQDKAKRDPRLYDLLARIYEKYELFSVDEAIFPTILFKAPKVQRESPESVLLKPIRKSPNDFEELAEEGASHLNRLEEINRIRRESQDENKPEMSLFNGDTFNMIKLQTEGRLGLECYQGKYFDMIKTCDSISFELLNKMGSDPDSLLGGRSAPESLNALKLRKKAHDASRNDPIHLGRGRSAVVGVSVLTLFRTQNEKNSEWATLIRERSQHVAVHRDVLCVIPSAVLASESGYPEEEYSIQHNVFREYLGEIFDRREIERTELAKKAPHFEWFYKYANLVELRKYLEKGKAELLLIGVAVDLLNLMPEILVLLIIHDKKWWQDHHTAPIGVPSNILSGININEEFKSTNTSIIRKIDLDNHLRPTKLDPSFSEPSRWIPFGAAAFYGGLELARERLDIRSN